MISIWHLRIFRVSSFLIFMYSLCVSSGLSRWLLSFGRWLNAFLSLLLTFKIKDDLKEELAKSISIKSLGFKVECNLILRLDLLVWLAHSIEEWVLERLVNTNTEVRIELEHAVQKVNTIRVHSRVLR